MQHCTVTVSARKARESARRLGLSDRRLSTPERAPDERLAFILGIRQPQR
jgi:hypothetical protein